MHMRCPLFLRVYSHTAATEYGAAGPYELAIPCVVGVWARKGMSITQRWISKLGIYSGEEG